MDIYENWANTRSVDLAELIKVLPREEILKIQKETVRLVETQITNKHNNYALLNLLYKNAMVAVRHIAHEKIWKDHEDLEKEFSEDDPHHPIVMLDNKLFWGSDAMIELTPIIGEISRDAVRLNKDAKGMLRDVKDKLSEIEKKISKAKNST